MRRLIVLLVLLASRAHAQLPHEDHRGVSALGLALRELATTKRVLVIAAHPDDEDSQLISVLSLGQGADVAYLSLTRGEGGQNSIGGELGPALGILRTGELLAARELDRAQQFFTRAYDFGYSKTADETLRHWPRDSILADVVATVRRYRPDIIVAVFSGTPSDGHGQHQVSGMLARDAFTAAADSSRFPAQLRAGLRAHRAKKLFQSANFRGTPTHRIPTGILDPLLGRSYSQLAAASRSRHRSQDFGAIQPLGPRNTAVALIQSNVGGNDAPSLFAGIDTTLSAQAVSARENTGVVRALQRYDSLISFAQGRLSAYSSEAVVPLLTNALRELSTAAKATRAADLRATVAAKVAATQSALLQSAGIVFDVVSSTERIVPGEAFNLDVTVWNGGRSALRIVNVRPALSASWQVQRTDSAGDTVGAGDAATFKFVVRPALDAPISQPYYLARPRAGAVYAWPAAQPMAGLPFEPAPIRAELLVELAGVQLSADRSATRRVLDPRQGELRRAVHVTPAFVVRPDPSMAVVTRASLTSGVVAGIEAAVEITSNGQGGNVTIKPLLPAGWRSDPVERSATATSEPQSIKFLLTPPRAVGAGLYDVRFVATDTTGRNYDLSQRVIDYPHIVNRVLYEPAVLQIRVLDTRFARGLRVGYVVGVDAPVPPVLEQLGIAVDRLDAAALASADLGKYDALVVGSRAYEVRPDLIAHNARILDYGRRGGNVVVLYQQYEFIQGNFAPFALTLARPHDRITDEKSPVRLIRPDDAALRRPNQIGAIDFEEWIQERALYMPNSWADDYAPLLEMSDPDEAPKQGAILTARLGSGYYTYTGIAFFREIPAGVPGAIRLFVNLLSLGMKDASL